MPLLVLGIEQSALDEGMAVAMVVTREGVVKDRKLVREVEFALVLREGNYLSSNACLANVVSSTSLELSVVWLM